MKYGHVPLLFEWQGIGCLKQPKAGYTCYDLEVFINYQDHITSSIQYVTLHHQYVTPPLQDLIRYKRESAKSYKKSIEIIPLQLIINNISSVF